MLSDKEIVCPNNLLDVAHRKKGILAGMPGAAEYENLVNNFMKNDLENENIVNFENILPGKATSRMSAQSLAHIVMVLFIIIGNVSYFLSRKKGNRF